jgi:RNA polymerase sigma-70 factor, ECF subfamily
MPSGDGPPATIASSSALQELAAELYARSGAANYGVGSREFTELLGEIARKCLSEEAGAAEFACFYRSLHVEELGLARGCAAGNERAWQDFIDRYREKLYRAARGIAGDDSGGRELADSIYAELYGARRLDGRRNSKLLHYSGRGSLEGWLRTVLAQEYVNGCRRSRRTVSLDELNQDGERFRAQDTEGAVEVDPRLAVTIDEALAALSPEERYLLASYYLDGTTLADIGRVLGAHESTISRRLTKLAASLREDILAGMMRRGMSRRQAEEAIEADVRDVNVDIRRRLTQDSAKSTFSGEKRVPAPEAEP